MQVRRIAISLLLVLAMLAAPAAPTFANYAVALTAGGAGYDEALTAADTSYDAAQGRVAADDAAARTAEAAEYIAAQDAGEADYAVVQDEADRPVVPYDLTHYIRSMKIAGEGGMPSVVAHPDDMYYFYEDYSYGRWLAPLIPAYNMDWTKADGWNLSKLYHQFTMYNDAHYLSAGGVRLSSGDTLDYTSGSREIYAYDSENNPLARGSISAYFPKLAYDKEAVKYVQLIDVQYEYNNNSEIGGGAGGLRPFAEDVPAPSNSVGDYTPDLPAPGGGGTPGGSGAGGEVSDPDDTGVYNIWPKYVEPAHRYKQFLIGLTSTPGAVVGSYGQWGWGVKILDSRGIMVYGEGLQEYQTEVYLPTYYYYEPGEYSVVFEYYEFEEYDERDIRYTRIDAKTILKFIVEDYSDFKSFSINGVDGVIKRDGSSRVEISLPEGTDLTKLKPEFTVADGSTVKIGDKIQKSGETDNDFTGRTAYYTIESARGSRTVEVVVSLTKKYNLIGEIKYADPGRGADFQPLPNERFYLFDYSSREIIGEIRTDDYGIFQAEIEYADKFAKNGFLLGVSKNYGRPVDTDKGVLINDVMCLIYPNVYTKVIYGKSLGKSYTFRGRVQDEEGVALVGAAVSWDGVNWANSGSLGGFEFDFDNHWQWDSYGFTVSLPGYQSGYFSIRPASDESTLALLQNSYIDLGIIKLKKLPEAANANISVYVSPYHTQRGKPVEVSLKYKSDVDAAGARITASVPEGVKIVGDSLTDDDATISENSVRLTKNLAAGQEYKLGFWIYADESFKGNYFTVDAELSGNSGLVALGSGSISLSDITIDLPAEVGIDGGNSKPFTIKGEASAIDGYTIDIVVTDAQGKTYETTAATRGIPAADDGPWYRVNDVVIKDLGTKSGVFLVKAYLKDRDKATVSEAAKVVFVRENALELKDIHLFTDNADIHAAQPISNSSYVAASIFVNNDFSGRYNLNIDTYWNKMHDLDLNVPGTSIKYIMQTNLGVFERDATMTDSGDDTLIKAAFASGNYSAGVYRGFSTGHIYLEIKRPGAGEAIYFHVASLTFLIDPAGYVYDAATRDLITGALVTLEKREDGVWTRWAAENHNQHNPQVTDENGAYGWMVPKGEYRVVVEAEGYATYRTDESSYGVINVPPPRDDVNIGLERPGITTSVGALAGGFVGEAYSAALAANLSGALTWSVADGVLPAGLSLDAGSGRISGSPTAVGTSNFKITVSNGSFTSEAKAFSIKIDRRTSGGGGYGGSSATPLAASPGAIDTGEAPDAPTQGGLLFADMRADDWFYADVEYVVDKGIFTGTSETTFSPLLSITRGMMATVLGRIHGVDASAYTTSSFSDVPADQYYAPYVEWAKESGVVLGVGENKFEPDAGITRQDIAVMITRYAEFADKRYPETRKFNVFADSNEIGDYAKSAIDSLCNGNIINGVGDNMFNPRGLASRAEVSAILHRFMLAVGDSEWNI
ncbi:MAG: S-layer homology domain-containing protein [Clostridiales Family XIII bacterium]|jgi:hypothetical protein|nr:S-layer homology domain-containing protein [Clostridiales Family XIII bacterium]